MLLPSLCQVKQIHPSGEYSYLSIYLCSSSQQNPTAGGVWLLRIIDSGHPLSQTLLLQVQLSWPVWTVLPLYLSSTPKQARAQPPPTGLFFSSQVGVLNLKYLYGNRYPVRHAEPQHVLDLRKWIWDTSLAIKARIIAVTLKNISSTHLCHCN